MSIPAQHEIGAFEAKNKLGTLLDWVEAGDRYTHHPSRPARSRASSRPTPGMTAPPRSRGDALLAATRGWRLDGVTVNELRDEGRR